MMSGALVCSRRPPFRIPYRRTNRNSHFSPGSQAKARQKLPGLHFNRAWKEAVDQNSSQSCCAFEGAAALAIRAPKAEASLLPSARAGDCVARLA